MWSFISWILYGDKPTHKQMDQALRARPRDTSFHEWTITISKRLGGGR